MKKTKKISLLCIPAGLMVLIPLLLSAGCIGNSPVPAELQLNGTRWTLTDYVSTGSTWHILDGTTITMLFGDDGKITGSAGCNHYFASYEMKGTKISIGPAGSTEMYCMGTGVMEQERIYLSLLHDAVSLTAKNTTLSFADSKGTTILSFERIVPPSPAPFVGTTWILDSFCTTDSVSSGIKGIPLTAVFDNDGRVTGSAGCNDYFGSYTLTGNSLSIHSIGSTKMNCPGRGIMLQEQTYLASLGKAAGFTINGNRMSLSDAKGTTLLSFIRQS
ncbi:MAG: META domain-containing protein [Methanolinea sp.]